MVAVFFRGRVFCIEGQICDGELKKPEIKRCEFNQKVETRIDGRHVRGSNHVQTSVLNVQPPGHTVEGRSVVAGREITADAHRVGHDVCGRRVVHRFKPDGFDIHRGVARQRVDAGRDAGVGDEGGDIKSSGVDPLVPDAPCWNLVHGGCSRRLSRRRHVVENRCRCWRWHHR